jgi:uncharacterized pyridoxamine 5'-phosphate oxidase family protein
MTVVESVMEFKDYVKFANENPASYVVTVEGDQPLVRDFLCGVLMSLVFF